MCESELRRAAFGDLPVLTPRLTAKGVAGQARSRLLTAVVLGAQGRYAAATAVLNELSRQLDPVMAALAFAALGSHRRQLGGHTAAHRLDGAALALTRRGDVSDPVDSDGLDAAGARTDALLGLAADNLALGRLTAARRLVAAANAIPAGWRTGVRTGWVSAEVELASDAPAAAIVHAERALDAAKVRGALRHTIKSELVLGAALAATGDPGARDRATGLIAGVLAATEKYGLDSLRWPAGLLAADLEPLQAKEIRSRAAMVFHAVLLRSDPGGRQIAVDSPWTPT